MPVTLTRSILVVLVPGLVATAPWALYVASKIPQFPVLYTTYATLINVSLLGLAVIVGSVIEDAMTHLEVRWDKQRESEFAVRQNWFDYLAKQCAAEPVGFRYIARMVTAFYFKLAMMVASPIALAGTSVLIFDHAKSYLVAHWILAARAGARIGVAVLLAGEMHTQSSLRSTQGNQR